MGQTLYKDTYEAITEKQQLEMRLHNLKIAEEVAKELKELMSAVSNIKLIIRVEVAQSGYSCGIKNLYIEPESGRLMIYESDWDPYDGWAKDGTRNVNPDDYVKIADLLEINPSDIKSLKERLLNLV